MQKIGDLLRSQGNCVLSDAGTLLKLAYLLQIDLADAEKAFQKYGCGHIYAEGGFVVPDTPRWRYKVCSVYGKCVIIDKSGKMRERTKEDIGTIRRRKERKNANIERHEIRRNERELRKMRNLQGLFRDGQTMPEPKRAGRANSHADIGKYVSHRGLGVAIMEPRGHTRLVKFKINI